MINTNYSNAFSEAFNASQEGASKVKNFLYNVLFVDLQDMELSQAAEYRTYKIALQGILMIASLAALIALPYAGVMGLMHGGILQMSPAGSVFWVLGCLGLIGGGPTLSLGCSWYGMLRGGEFEDYEHLRKRLDERLSEGTEPQMTFATMRDYKRQLDLEWQQTRNRS